MKCYIDLKCVNPQAPHSEHEWYADVVSEQDYHERGAHARSHRTGPHPGASLAVDSAQEWAEEFGYVVCDIADI